MATSSPRPRDPCLLLFLWLYQCKGVPIIPHCYCSCRHPTPATWRDLFVVCNRMQRPVMPARKTTPELARSQVQLVTWATSPMLVDAGCRTEQEGGQPPPPSPLLVRSHFSVKPLSCQSNQPTNHFNERWPRSPYQLVISCVSRPQLSTVHRHHPVLSSVMKNVRLNDHWS